MDSQSKIAYCQIVAQLLIIDGMLTDDERAFLGSLMTEMELDEEQRHEVHAHVNIDDPLEDRIRAIGAENLKQVITELKAASSVDGDMSAVERRLIEAVEELVGGE